MAADLTFTSDMNDAGFRAGLSRMLSMTTAAAGRIGNSLSGAFTIGALAMFGKSVTDLAGDLKDTSMALGMTTDELQGQQAAFATAGVSAEEYRAAMGKLTEAQQAVLGGDEKMRGAFEALGISFDQVANSSIGELLFKMADGFKNADDHGKAFAATVDILGKGGKKMAAGLAEGRKERSDAATKMSPSAVNTLEKAADDATEGFRKLKAAAGNAFAAILEGLEKVLVDAPGQGLPPTPPDLEDPTRATPEDPRVTKQRIQDAKNDVKAADDQIKQADKRIEAGKERQRQYDRASADERRQMRRDQADDDRISRRRKRMDDRGERETTPGAKKRRDEIEAAAAQKKEAEATKERAETNLSEASMSSLAQKIGVEIDKIVVRP